MISAVDRYKRDLQRTYHSIQHHFISPDPNLFKSAVHLKIQLLGDSGVGKTTLKKYLEFDELRITVPTIAIEISSIQLRKKVKNETIQITIQDISGEFDRYHSMLRSSYRGIHAAILICSVDQSDSVLNLRKKWWPELKDYAPEAVDGLILVNKCDLLHSTNIGHENV